MKALLNQFIGGGPGKGDIMSAAGSGSQKVQGDSTGADASSFMGLMMGFLGINQNMGSAANGDGAAPSEANTEGKNSADDTSILVMSAEISGKSNAGEAASTGENKSADGASIWKMARGISGKLNGNAGSVKSTEANGERKANTLSAAEKLKARPTNQTAEKAPPGHQSAESIANSSLTSAKSFVSEAAAGQIESTEGKIAEGHMKAGPKAEKGNIEAAAKVQGRKTEAGIVTGTENSNAKAKTAKAPVDKTMQQLKANGESGKKTLLKEQKNGFASNARLSQNGTAKNTMDNPAAGSGQAEGKAWSAFDKIAAAGKDQANSTKQASRAQVENIIKQSAGDSSEIVNEGKKNPVAAADVIKKAQQKQAEKLKIKSERGRVPEAGTRRSAAQGSHSASTPVSVQNSELLLRKPAFDGKNLTPGKMVSSEMPGKVEDGGETDAPLSREGGQASEKGFKEIHLNEFKSASLAEASGRKKFSKHLGEVGRRQAGKSGETARKDTQWKQHRFVLKDGKAINISARTADGALQLQLNAGSGELNKMLHRHLQEIRQHVQQELNIEIDLQMQDFSGRQSDQQQEAGSSSQTQTKKTSNSGLGERGGMAPFATSSGTERMRYFGFNNNEWTA